MKKQILLLGTFFIAALAFGQSTTSFGLRAGVASSGMKGEAVNSLNSLLEFSDGMITTRNRTGFYGGGFASIPLSEAVSLEPGLYYAQRVMNLLENWPSREPNSWVQMPGLDSPLTM